MRAKQRVISSEVIVEFGDNLMVEIAERGSGPANVEIQSVLRRAVAQVNNYLADQTIPATIEFHGVLLDENPQPPPRGLLNWFWALVNRTTASSAVVHRQHLPVTSSDEPTGVLATRC